MPETCSLKHWSEFKDCFVGSDVSSPNKSLEDTVKFLLNNGCIKMTVNTFLMIKNCTLFLTSNQQGSMRQNPSMLDKEAEGMQISQAHYF